MSSTLSLFSLYVFSYLVNCFRYGKTGWYLDDSKHISAGRRYLGNLEHTCMRPQDTMWRHLAMAVPLLFEGH